MLPIFLTIESEEERNLAENLYLTYKSKMYRIAYAVLHNKEDAEDVVMDSVCKIVKHISKFLGADRNKTESLIVIIVRNTAINRYHYNQHRQHIPMEEYSNMIPDDSGSPSEILIEQDKFDGLLQKIRSLDAIYRDVLLLKYLYEYDNSLIASLTGVAEATVRVRLMRAKRLLEQILKGGGTVIDLFRGSLSSGGNNTKCSIYAETEPITIDYNPNMALIYNGKEKRIEFTDVSNKGYEVAEWGIVEGITLKILPFYTNNRLLLLETEGLENAFATVSLTLYDSLGNSTKAFGSCDVENNDFFVEAENRLEGDIVKIEVNNFRISQGIEQQIFTIPLPDETAALDTPLYSSSLFADTATQIKRDGKFVYLTTVLRGVEDTQFRDFVVMYDFKGAKQVSDTLSYGEDGAYIYTYKIELPENAEELQMEATNYSCMMFATDEPAAVINITKK